MVKETARKKTLRMKALEIATEIRKTIEFNLKKLLINWNFSVFSPYLPLFLTYKAIERHQRRQLGDKIFYKG